MATPTTWRELCAELLSIFDSYDDESNLAGIFEDLKANNKNVIDRVRAELSQTEPVAAVGELSPREVEAQEAFMQLRDEVLNLSNGVEVNEVLYIVDNHTPEWV